VPASHNLRLHGETRGRRRDRTGDGPEARGAREDTGEHRPGSATIIHYVVTEPHAYTVTGFLKTFGAELKGHFRTQHYVMLQRNLLYTALTRGRRVVVLVGSKRALAIAVANNRIEARCTRLAERLVAQRARAGASGTARD